MSSTVLRILISENFMTFLDFEKIKYVLLILKTFIFTATLLSDLVQYWPASFFFTLYGLDAANGFGNFLILKIL